MNLKMEKSRKSAINARLTAFFNNRVVRAGIALFALAGAYGFASLAIDSGSLFDYALAFAWFILALHEAAGALFSRKRT